MKMMDLDNPTAHIDQFVKDNIDKQNNKKKFLDSLYFKILENDIMQIEQLNEFYKPYKDILSKKLIKLIDPPLRRPVGRPANFFIGEVT